METKEVEKNKDRLLVAHKKRIGEINDAMKHPNVRMIGIPKGVEIEGGLKGIFEQTIAENFPHLGKETSIRVQEEERTTPQINKNRSAPQPIIVKLANFTAKERILGAGKRKRFLMYRGRNIRITSDLSTETRQARKGWQDIFRVLNENHQLLANFMTTKPALQEILRGFYKGKKAPRVIQSRKSQPIQTKTLLATWHY